ncbi:MAG: CPBP family intramembrane metalloprotease [Clostridia bacterium]|nr:CPBP family intramembrane metalloprotease [Clostridia bacterium]
MLTDNERAFKQLMLYIGTVMLSFYGTFQLLGTVWSIADAILFAFLDFVTADVVSQLIYAAIYLVSFMLPVLFFRFMLGKTYVGMPLEPKLPKNSVVYVFAGVALILSMAYLNAMLLDVFNYSQFQSEMFDGPSVDANYQVVLAFITTAIVPAFCEEFLFRGAILTNLKPYGKAPAIIISAVLFGLMHQNAGQLLYATAAGLLLGWVAYETGSIWCGVLIHFVNNFVGVAESAVAQRIPASLANIVIPMFECLLFAAGVVCIVLIIRKREAEKRDAESETVVLPRGSLTKLFFSPTIIAFISLTGVTMLLYVAASALKNLFDGLMV